MSSQLQDYFEEAVETVARLLYARSRSAPRFPRQPGDRRHDVSGHLDGPPGPPDPPLRFDNATTVREIAYRCAGAGSGAVMRLASDVVMPAAEIGEAVEEILCDFWPEAAADQEKPETDT